MLAPVAGKAGHGRVLLSLRSVKKKVGGLAQLRLLLLPLFVSTLLLTCVVCLAWLKLSPVSRGYGFPLLRPATAASSRNSNRDDASGTTGTPPELAQALLHFATTPEVPQQSKAEIALVLGALQRRGACNLLVFGLWHDSLLWAALNYGGRTVFLDESEAWVARTRERHPSLESYRLDYTTRLRDAGALLAAARAAGGPGGACAPTSGTAETVCPLAITAARHGVPRAVVEEVQWDVVLIDGPRSYRNGSFPGRMSPIFTAAVMARARTAPGAVDVFLHDVSRPWEGVYAREFLCDENRVGGVDDMAHFRIAPSAAATFCGGVSSRSELVPT